MRGYFQIWKETIYTWKEMCGCTRDTVGVGMLAHSVKEALLF